MIMSIYSVWDSKADAYITPFFAPNDAVAIRMFSSAVEDSGHDFHRHSEDYSLFKIGQFNQNTAEIMPDNVTVIARAHELKGQTNV